MKAVAIDVGGTKTSIGVVTVPEGRVTALEVLASPQAQDDHAAFLESLVTRAETLAATHWADAIGVSVCELVDPLGNVTSGHRIRWQDLEVRERFSRIRPAVVEADVRAAALGEARLGAGRGLASFLYVNIGTGISSSLVLNGRVHAGARGNALALASSPTELRCPHCGEIAAHTLEDIAGGEGLLRAAKRLGLAVSSAAELFDSTEAGAIRLAQDATRGLGVSLGLAINLLDPEALVLGGGLILASPHYFDLASTEICRHIWSPESRQLPILSAALGPRSALVGAALKAADASPRLAQG